MKYLLWLLKAVIFFTLFAFALNNQRDVVVHFFFGTQWQAPLVLVVLLAFSAGVVVCTLALLPARPICGRTHLGTASQPPAAEAAAPAAAATSEASFKADTLPPHGI